MFSCDATGLNKHTKTSTATCTISDLVYQDLPGKFFHSNLSHFLYYIPFIFFIFPFIISYYFSFIKVYYPCGNHGTCDTLKGICTCEKGFNGEACQDNFDDQSVNFFYYDNPYFSGTLLHLSGTKSHRKYDLIKVMKDQELFLNVDDGGKLEQYKESYFYSSSTFGHKDKTSSSKDYSSTITSLPSSGSYLYRGYSKEGENVFSVSNDGSLSATQAKFGNLLKVNKDSIIVGQESSSTSSLFQINANDNKDSAFSVQYNGESVFKIEEDLTTLSNLKLSGGIYIETGGIDIVSGGIQVGSGGIRVSSGDLIIDGDVQLKSDRLQLDGDVEANRIKLKNKDDKNFPLIYLSDSTSSPSTSESLILGENLNNLNNFLTLKEEEEIIFNIKNDGTIESNGKLYINNHSNLKKLTLNNLVLEPLYLTSTYSEQLKSYHIFLPSDSSYIILLPSPNDVSFSVSFPTNVSAGYLLLLTNENSFSSSSDTLLIPPFSTNLFLFTGKSWVNLSGTNNKGDSSSTSSTLSTPVSSITKPNFHGLSLKSVSELSFLNDIDVGNHTLAVGALKVSQWPIYSIPYVDQNNEVKTAVKNFSFRKNILYVNSIKINKLAGDLNGDGYKIKHTILDEVEVTNALLVETNTLKIKNQSNGFLYLDSNGKIESLPTTSTNSDSEESKLDFDSNTKKVKLTSTDIFSSNLYSVNDLYLKRSNLNCFSNNNNNKNSLLLIQPNGKINCSNNLYISSLSAFNQENDNKLKDKKGNYEINDNEEILHINNLSLSNLHNNLNFNSYNVSNLHTLEVEKIKLNNFNGQNSLLSIDSNGYLTSIDTSNLINFQDIMKFKETTVEKTKTSSIQIKSLSNSDSSSPSSEALNLVLSNQDGELSNINGFQLNKKQNLKDEKQEEDEYNFYSSYPLHIPSIYTSSFLPLEGEKSIKMKDIEVNSGSLSNIKEIETGSLTVKENFEVLTSGYFGGSLSVEGTVIGSGPYVDSSDKKLKKDIKEIQPKESLELINSLNPVRYYYRSSEFPSRNLPTSLQIGFIAQEVQEILPELVIETIDPNPIHDKDNQDKNIEDNEEKTLSIAYSHLTPLLTGAIQELHKEMIETTKRFNEEMNEMKKILQNLQQENQKLKKLLALDQ